MQSVQCSHKMQTAALKSCRPVTFFVCFVFTSVPQVLCSSVPFMWMLHLCNVLREFLQIWYKSSLGLTDELIQCWWWKVEVHCSHAKTFWPSLRLSQHMHTKTNKHKKQQKHHHHWNNCLISAFLDVAFACVSWTVLICFWKFFHDVTLTFALGPVQEPQRVLVVDSTVPTWVSAHTTSRHRESMMASAVKLFIYIYLYIGNVFLMHKQSWDFNQNKPKPSFCWVKLCTRCHPLL